MPSAGFEPTISPGERSQTYASDRAATGTGPLINTQHIKQDTAGNMLRIIDFFLNISEQLPG